MEKSKEKKLLKNSGITLIALVITVIVLLILAGVTVATLTGDNGLLTKANEAKNSNEEAETIEQIKLSYLQYETGKYKKTDETLVDYMKTSLENIFNESINVEKVGKGIKITFTKSDKIYKCNPNGEVKKLMKSTNVYAKLDDNDILYLRATKKDGYKDYLNSSSIKSNWNTAGNANREKIKKVIIEEPIAPLTTRRYVYLL